MKGVFPIDKFRNIETPFYYYDTSLLRKTLDKIKQETSLYLNYHVHYAVKANANNRILSIIRETGFGADCVSGGEIKAALEAGFPAHKIVFETADRLRSAVFPYIEGRPLRSVQEPP